MPSSKHLVFTPNPLARAVNQLETLSIDSGTASRGKPTSLRLTTITAPHSTLSAAAPATAHANLNGSNQVDSGSEKHGYSTRSSSRNNRYATLQPQKSNGTGTGSLTRFVYHQLDAEAKSASGVILLPPAAEP